MCDYVYLAHISVNSKILLLSWHVNFLFVEVALYALEKCEKKKKEEKSL